MSWAWHRLGMINWSLFSTSENYSYNLFNLCEEKWYKIQSISEVSSKQLNAQRVKPYYSDQWPNTIPTLATMIMGQQRRICQGLVVTKPISSIRYCAPYTVLPNYSLLPWYHIHIDRCHRSWAAATPVIYEYNTMDLKDNITNAEMSLREKFINRAFATHSTFGTEINHIMYGICTQIYLVVAWVR